MVIEKNSLQLNSTLSQNITLSPQLQQCIKLLQLSNLEIVTEINTISERNPFLEIEERYPQEESLENIFAYEYEQDVNNDPFDNDSSIKNNDIDGIDSHRLFDDNGELYKESLDNNKYLSQDNFYKNTSSNEHDDFQEQKSPENLRSYLLWQLNLSPLKGMDKEIAINIIYGLNDDGYLIENEDDILNNLKDKYKDITKDDITTILKLIQHYDPSGVGARNLQEFLLIQIDELEHSYEIDITKKIIKNELSNLSKLNHANLLKKYKISEDCLNRILNIIKNLKTKPIIDSPKDKTDIVIPDILVIKNSNGNYDVELTPNLLPKVSINETYKKYIHIAKDVQEKKYLQSNLKEADLFLKSLNMRNETILKVAKCIVAHQHDFMEKGESAMHPLILKDIASEIDMHESSISRVTTKKYMLTPKGIFELKHFFSSALNTNDGNETSATAIKANIKQLIAKEDPRKPLSDNAIVEILKEQGFLVARRTVAKYRESLRIAPSSQRRQLL